MTVKSATATPTALPSRITERRLGISSFTSLSTFNDLVDALPDDRASPGFSKKDAWQLLIVVAELSGTDGLVSYHDLSRHFATVRSDLPPETVLELTSLLLDTGFLNCV